MNHIVHSFTLQQLHRQLAFSSGFMLLSRRWSFPGTCSRCEGNSEVFGVGEYCVCDFWVLWIWVDLLLLRDSSEVKCSLSYGNLVTAELVGNGRGIQLKGLGKMKRKVSQQKSQHRWRRKLFAVLLLGICFGTLLFMQTQYSRIKGLASLQHRFVDRPKIAFLFIARNRLPLEMVWDAFFQVRYSINLSFCVCLWSVRS